MSVVLYHRTGKIKKVEPEVLRSYLNGEEWFKSAEKAQRSDPISLSEKTDEEIRAIAKEKGIDHWHLKKIDTLIKEVEAWQPEA